MPRRSRAAARVGLLQSLSALLTALGVLVSSAAAGGASASRALPRGAERRRIASIVGARVLDPALEGGARSMLLAGTCATLMMPGQPLRFEAAAGPPVVSRDRRTYTYTVRRGLRFSDGTRLTAANFATELLRI